MPKCILSGQQISELPTPSSNRFDFILHTYNGVTSWISWNAYLPENGKDGQFLAWDTENSELVWKNETVDYENTKIFGNNQNKTIPVGRVIGDVNGDGKITAEDSNAILAHTINNPPLTGEDLICADVNQDELVNSFDAAIVNNLISASTTLGEENCIDIKGNWIINPNYASEEGQYYITIQDPDVFSTKNTIISFSGEGANNITNVVFAEGSFTVYITIPPIEPIRYAILATSSIKPIGRTVTLSSSAWSSNSQTVAVQGVNANTTGQIIDWGAHDQTSYTALASAQLFISASTSPNQLVFTALGDVPTSNVQVDIRIQEAQGV